MRRLTCLDLFSGLGGASAAMRDRGWDVVSVDCLEWLKPTVVADVRHLPLQPYAADLLWSSPTCTEYTRKALPWYPNEPDPDLTLWQASQAIIAEFRPRYWVIENVQGAVRYWGQPAYRFGSRLLWTNIYLLPMVERMRGKMSIGGNRKRSVFGSDPLAYWKRSKIPYALSEAIAITIEGFAQ